MVIRQRCLVRTLNAINEYNLNVFVTNDIEAPLISPPGVAIKEPVGSWLSESSVKD
jgi:hypothetical protein